MIHTTRVCFTTRSQDISALHEITADAPFRHMATPSGYKMSVAMTNCGTVGWVTEHSGYCDDTITR
ncbi:2OG-Fe(II) oxygenase family protein [Rickettsiales endosymbiont of Stachyamoeba lipophora]|uniref:hypothetical protein n=1 Tax=Rickettsiales endosymbiont of Stachyamoeba lipophora TaxID=2486578 RepID=UPI0019CFA229|nr:hypothetical protein [Rickettsiales endosymbiont of Stachyamoeba lipophora]